MSVSVPAYTTIYNAAVTDNIADGLAVDTAATYVDGSPQVVGTVLPAAPFNGPAALNWDIGDFTNNTGATRVVQLRLTVHVRTDYSGGGAGARRGRLRQLRRPGVGRRGHGRDAPHRF